MRATMRLMNRAPIENGLWLSREERDLFLALLETTPQRRRIAFELATIRPERQIAGNLCINYGSLRNQINTMLVDLGFPPGTKRLTVAVRMLALMKRLQEAGLLIVEEREEIVMFPSKGKDAILSSLGISRET